MLARATSQPSRRKRTEQALAGSSTIGLRPSHSVKRSALASGEMVDRAMIGRATAILDLAAATDSARHYPSDVIAGPPSRIPDG